ncbi:MAG: hypothetical protein WBA46_01425 [Thermomicrobiales bacterium]
MADSQLDEQIQLAREIGDELTDAFVAFIRGDVGFDDLTFGVYDALSDLHVIASGEYELEEVVEGEETSDHDDDEDDDVDDELGEQEELAQEPVS